MAIEVQSADLIRVLIQFLRENDLNDTAKCLQSESKVNLNYIEDRREFSTKVTSGRWDEVLEEISQLSLSEAILIEIHEQIFNEMLEINELEAARALLRQGSPLKQLKKGHLEKYLKLENLLSQTVLNGEIPAQIKDTKQNRRERLANLILEHVQDIPKARLMSIISSALKWEEHCGTISGNSSYNLLLGQVPTDTVSSLNDSITKFPKNCYKSVKLPSGSHAECVGFSPNGAFFIVGTADGFLEVWNPLEGTLRTDLPYQTCDKDLMSMKGAISCISFSQDGEYLAVGTIEGEIGIWRLSTGKLTKSFQNVHQNGITSISFSPDQQSLLTTGFDNNIHILGMKSGRILKELRGHTSYINCAIWLDEGAFVLSGSHDGSLKLWDLNRVECISTSYPKEEKSLSPPPIKSIVKLVTTESDVIFLVSSQSSKLHLYSLSKQDFIQTVPVKLKDANLISSEIRKGQVFALSSDGFLFGFKSDDLSSSIGSEKVSNVEPIGFALHPKLNILVSFDVSGEIKFWK